MGNPISRFNRFSKYLIQSIGCAVLPFLSACQDDPSAVVPPIGAATPAPTAIPSVPKHAFLSTGTHNGSFGGSAAAAMTAADAFCTADAGNTNSGVYKALMQNSARTTSTNWVLQATTQYKRLSDNAIIGTTNASKTFTFNLSNPFGAAGTYGWTGMDGSWGAAADNCTDWTSSSGAVNGQMAATSYVDFQSISYSTDLCSSGLKIICIEQ